ncbi:PR-1-like protein [Tuber magnatum]|uniref:PR-1-like protein n=1 Tax=Tuber magnatum TaxID=42249 RepID=A0A317SUT6_9PEZI|nr:PR-1-like protein [Tuber magnatum]
MLNPLPLFLISTLLSSTTALYTGISPRSASPQSGVGDGDPYLNNDLPRFKSEILEAHNARRREFGVAPLSWDNELWMMAKSVTRTCVFEHSGGPYGENLYGSSGGNAKSAVDAFADEVKNYRDDNLIWNENWPTTKDGTMIGHYTQVAWKDTIKVACATSDQRCNFSGGAMWFVVCEYWPPGNVISASENLYQKNVGRPGEPFKEPAMDINGNVPPYKGGDIQLPESLANDHSGGSSPSPNPEPAKRRCS